MPTNDETKDKSFAETWKQPGTTVLPIMIVESKDIALAAFQSMPRNTYEAYIATKAAKQIFAVLDNLHIVENWSTQKGKGVPLLLKQIGAYKDVKKKFGVLK